MSHPFGDLLLQYRARKRGLSQTRLAHMAGCDPAILARMCAGKKDLTGPSGRDRVVRVIDVLCKEGVLSTLDEANALLTAADMPPLYDGLPVEATLIRKLNPSAAAARAIVHPVLERPRQNLPAQLTSFIGRANEIGAVEQLLRERRMVTLTGVGGVGKTRLAIEIGARVLDTVPDGVWLVDLAPFSDPALVARAVCATFNLQERPERTDLQMTLTFLERKRLLLILDNCEHLSTACAELAEHVLRACPNVRLMATSRERLRIPGETPLRVQSLTTPDATSVLTTPDLLRYEAAQLFIERTRAGQPGFEMMPQQIAAIAEICNRLDGIPLALEMAAAQTNAMTIEEIAARLDDRFGILTSGARTALPRHRTLRAMLDWSYDLLSPAEQRLLVRLSVFAGGWTAEAAEAIYAKKGAMSLLVQLVHKSLVVAEPQDGRTRYRLLETVRQFAGEKLAALGEAEATRRRHCDYFTALVEQFEPTMISPRLRTWGERVDADWSNLRAAVDWGRQQADGGVRLARIAGSLSQFWIKRVAGRERVAWLEEAVRRTTAADGLPRAQALLALAASRDTCAFLDRPHERSMVDESLLLSQRANDATGVAYARMYQVMFVDFREGDAEEHIASIEQALQMFRQANQALGIGEALRLLAMMHIALGNQAQAATALEENYRLGCETTETMWLWPALTHLGSINGPRAVELCEQALAQQRARGDAEGIAACLQVLGRIHVIAGNYAVARSILEECHACWQALGCTLSWPGGTARALLDLGAVLGSLGNYDRAIATLHQAASEYDQVGDTHGVAWALSFSGRALLLKGGWDRAERDLRESVRLYKQIEDPDGAAVVLVLLADIAQARGQVEHAMRLLGAAASREPNPMNVPDMPPGWRAAHHQAIADARARSNDPAFAAAWAEGEDIERVISIVLEQENV